MTNTLQELTRRPSDNPVLERIETELPPGDAAEQIDEILRQPDAGELFQSIEAPAFYRLMKRAGWDQSYDLIQYASADQIQVFFDFDCWQRDRLLPEKMDKWFGALVSEADDDHFQEVMRDLDPQIPAIFFKANLRVEHTDEEQRPPAHLEGNVEVTPDNMYAVVYPDDEDRAALFRTLIDRLYHVDRVLAWTLLEAVSWELMSDMEEKAYGWRNSRLEEFGFVKREEAVEIYQFVDPVDYRERLEAGETEEYADVNPPERLDLPDVFRQEFDDEFYVFQAVKAIRNDTTLRRILFELRALINRAMIADGIEPGEIETGREVIRRSLGYLSLGLEFLSRTDIDTAQTLLIDQPVKEIFQVGFSLASKLKKKMEKLKDNPTLSIIETDELSLLGPNDRAVAESLLRHRPTFAEDRQTFDIFKTQEQLDNAAFSVGMIGFKQVWLFGLHADTVADIGEVVYGDATHNSPDDVTFDVLFATSIANFLTAEEPELDPLDADHLGQLPAILREAPWEEDLEGYFDEVISPIVEAAPATSPKLARRWLEETLETLDEELGAVQSIDEPKFFTPVLLVANE
ncbi:MAG: DUF6178 family protein [Bradymonadaceae bacterium]